MDGTKRTREELESYLWTKIALKRGVLFMVKSSALFLYRAYLYVKSAESSYILYILKILPLLRIFGPGQWLPGLVGGCHRRPTSWFRVFGPVTCWIVWTLKKLILVFLRFLAKSKTKAVESTALCALLVCLYRGRLVLYVLYLRPRFKLMKSRTSKIHFIFDDYFNVNKMELGHGGADFAYVVLFRRIF